MTNNMFTVGRKFWLPIMIISGIIFVMSMILSLASLYSAVRSFEYAGIHRFYTTGDTSVKTSIERTGRKTYENVQYVYATFKTRDGQFSDQKKVTKIQRSRINSGTVYSRVYEVHVDKYGRYKVVDVGNGSGQNGTITTVFIFMLLTLASLGVIWISFKHWTRIRMLSCI